MRWLGALLLCMTSVATAADAGLLTAAEMKKAEKLDKRKCYRCHKPYDPRDYSSAEWDDWMDRMSRKARLKEKDEDLLRRYFEVRRAGDGGS